MESRSSASPLKKTSDFRRTIKRVYEHRSLYIIFLPVLVYYVIFAYMPMFNPRTGGLFLAFKHYRMNAAFTEMKWVGFQWFQMLMSRKDFWNAFTNTIVISLGRLVFEFPLPIILAILLNELKLPRVKRTLQTIFTFPNFLSWILVIGIMRDFLMVDGTVNEIIKLAGGEPFNFMANPGMIANLLLVFISNIWKISGWSAIIYLAAISGIDPALYEAAYVDGANRWHCVRYITWPCIKGTAVVLLILACGNMLNAGFEQVFNMQNGVNMRVLSILDTYIYHMSFTVSGGSVNMGFTVAAGLFKSVINFSLVLGANKIARALGDSSLF